MKQAILITAYKNFDHLKNLVDFFDGSFEVYIHLDKKSKIPVGMIDGLISKTNVKLVYQRYKVNWGGFNHLKSILFLAERALESREDLGYFHLISGHDFPIKKPMDFKDFFWKRKGEEYLDVFNIPKQSWGKNGGLDRILFYNFYDLFNSKIPKQRVFIKKIIHFQRKYLLQRPLSKKFPKLYGGSTWWSLSRECLEYVLNFTNNNRGILQRFRYTLCSEEFYFQTIIMNSKHRSNVVNNNLRYIDWVARNGNNPAILDDSDYAALKVTDAFFARKFENPISDTLLKKITTINS